jgi:septation ring formation regulator EzrA
MGDIEEHRAQATSWLMTLFGALAVLGIAAGGSSVMRSQTNNEQIKKHEEKLKKLEDLPVAVGRIEEQVKGLEKSAERAEQQRDQMKKVLREIERKL